MKHLWEVDHPYYANEGNYYAKIGDCHQDFDTIEAFLEAEGRADIDMNLVYRWDWKIDNTEDESEDKRDRLCFYFIGQRKALARSVEVKISPGDRERVEPLVKQYLMPRLRRLLELWAPLITRKLA
jgi:hypothetical protein